MGQLIKNWQYIKFLVPSFQMGRAKCDGRDWRGRVGDPILILNLFS